MGLDDRPYAREESTFSAGYGARGRGGNFLGGMPRPGQVVKTLLMLNGIMYIAQLFGSGLVERFLAADSAAWWQVWRYVSFQFLHSTRGFMHLLFNMLLLYFLGTPLEKAWGPKRFLTFYLSSGAVAGVAYVLMARLMGLDGYLIGASGGVYAILLACAVLFPHIRLIVLFFPVPIRLVVTIYFAIMILTLLRTFGGGGATGDFWSQVAHFGGALGGAFWIWVMPRVETSAGQVQHKMNQGAWEKKQQRQAAEQKSIDEILEKVHSQGINSLTRKEKKTLADATKRQQ